jgi:hypothetical protein
MSTVPVPFPGDAPSRPLPGSSAARCFLALGLLLRLVHYVWNHTIWYDEAVLLFNILGKDYGRLLGPLDYEVAAPPLYLWALRSLALLVGDHPYLWRFPSFAISCLLLWRMAALARRVLRPTPAAVVVGLVAFSDAFVWLGCNVKPYILDAFLATCLLEAYVRTEDWELGRRLLLFLLLAPVLFGLSYPALFLYAGLLLAFLPQVWRARRPGVWAAYVGLAFVVALTLAALYFGPIHAQRVPGLVAGWKNKFPDLSRPASVPGWILGNTFLVFHYCYNPIGSICVLLAAAGVWWCLRHGRFDLVCLGIGPVAACLLAACAQVYPFSNNRLIAFAAPGIGVMSGLGLSVLTDARCRIRWGLMTLAALLIGPEIGLCLMHLHRPWVQPDSAGVTRFVKQHCQAGDLIASDDGTYRYYFFGEVRPMQEGAASGGDGQRVWVLVDHSTNDRRRHLARAWFAAPAWELCSETVFQGASVLLFRRGRAEETAAPVAPVHQTEGNLR